MMVIRGWACVTRVGTSARAECEVAPAWSIVHLGSMDAPIGLIRYIWSLDCVFEFIYCHEQPFGTQRSNAISTQTSVLGTHRRSPRGVLVLTDGKHVLGLRCSLHSGLRCLCECPGGVHFGKAASCLWSAGIHGALRDEGVSGIVVFLDVADVEDLFSLSSA